MNTNQPHRVPRIPATCKVIESIMKRENESIKFNYDTGKFERDGVEIDSHEVNFWSSFRSTVRNTFGGWTTIPTANEFAYENYLNATYCQ